LLPDGRAAGRTEDGLTVRVAGGVPGDVVEYRRTGGTGRTVDADVVEVVTPSAHRRDPLCPHSASCGGCDLDRLDDDARADALATMVAHAFRWDGPVPLHRSPARASRARIKLAIVDGRLGYRAARSHDLVPVDVCGVARPEVQAAHARLAAWLTPERARGLAAVELRSDGERVAGDPVLWLTVDGVRLRVGPASFYQVNPDVNAALVGAVGDAVRERGAERVLDLYAGIGNLGLPIAARGTPVVAVEAPGAGAEDLRFNAQQVGRTEVLAHKVEKVDPSRIPFDAVVLDPPRAGAPGVLAKVARNRPKVVVYVSCFAPSAARDLKELDKYALVSLRAFDLFPDTHHVEALAVLERR
jgi:tRNA/tmRNA/rRNA uracil-C5-methylase (TrmA/RlmC/RlmD family)